MVGDSHVVHVFDTEVRCRGTAQAVKRRCYFKTTSFMIDFVIYADKLDMGPGIWGIISTFIATDFTSDRMCSHKVSSCLDSATTK